MNYKIILASVLILSISNPPATAYCRKGDSKSTDYIRREKPNRCEGMIELVSGNDLNLISLATRKIANFGKTLTLQIPKINGGKQPEIKVTSLADNYHYQLDDFSLSHNSSLFSFSWDTDVLRKKEVPANKLRAVAYYNLDSQPVYVPVILGQTSGEYEFVFYSESRVSFTRFKILSQAQKTMYSTSQTNPRNGETIFTWDGRNAPSGRYEIHYNAFIDRRNEPPLPIKNRIIFEHNPNWLK